ncbi:hypothetical protein D3C80_1890630 [compost metagenome]
MQIGERVQPGQGEQLIHQARGSIDTHRQVVHRMFTHGYIVPRQLHHLGLHPQCGQWAAQLMGSIRSKPTLTHQQAINARKQRIQRFHQRAHLTGYLVCIQRRSVVWSSLA